MQKIHHLKILPEFFKAVKSGNKKFELRKNDRGFMAGDSLKLNEWNPDSGYTGNAILAKITYILDGSRIAGISPDYCILSIVRYYPDDLCEKCNRRGCCCFSSTFINGLEVVTDWACRYLDMETRKCTVYAHRHELNLDCLTIEAMIKFGTVPKSCPYVANDLEYQARTDIRLYDFKIIGEEMN